jgi:hypothetical protein
MPEGSVSLVVEAMRHNWTLVPSPGSHTANVRPVLAARVVTSLSIVGASAAQSMIAAAIWTNRIFRIVMLGKIMA